MIQFFILCTVMLFSLAECNESISGNDDGYRNICRAASENEEVFQTFRNHHDFRKIVEDPDFSRGCQYHEYLMSSSARIKNALPMFEQLDRIGSPVTYQFALGTFSPATLRYINIAEHITRIFSLPTQAKIVEVGGGFGGQCFVLSQVQDFESYYIYDLPEVRNLISKMLSLLGVEKAQCLETETSFSEEKLDLFISNYAFSECDKDMQMWYFDNVLKKCERGYVVYNQISSLFGVNSMTAKEFIHLLRQNDMHPQVDREIIPTYHSNILITWDQSR